MDDARGRALHALAQAGMDAQARGCVELLRQLMSTREGGAALAQALVEGVDERALHRLRYSDRGPIHLSATDRSVDMGSCEVQGEEIVVTKRSYRLGSEGAELRSETRELVVPEPEDEEPGLRPLPRRRQPRTRRRRRPNPIQPGATVAGTQLSPASARLTRRQLEVMAALPPEGGSVTWADLRDAVAVTAAVVRRLEARGLVRVTAPEEAS